MASQGVKVSFPVWGVPADNEPYLPGSRTFERPTPETSGEEPPDNVA